MSALLQVQIPTTQALNSHTSTSYWDRFHQVDNSNIPSLLDLSILLPEKDHFVLDFGFGKGRNLRQLLKRGFENLIGFELSRDCIAQMQKDTSVPVHHFDELPKLASTLRVDTFLMFGVFSTIADQSHRDLLVKSVNSVLKKSGRLVIYDYSYDPLRSAQYQTVSFGQHTHCLLQPAWSEYPFIHYAIPEIKEIFSDLFLIQATELAIPSFKHPSAPGCLMVFQK